MNKIEIIDDNAMGAMRLAMVMTMLAKEMRRNGDKDTLDYSYVSSDANVVFFAETMFHDDDDGIQRLGRSVLMQYIDMALDKAAKQ